MNEIDDVSPKDQEELTFQASQPFDLSFRDENVANEGLLFDEESYHKWEEENDDEVRKTELKIVKVKENNAAKIIQHNYEKRFLNIHHKDKQLINNFNLLSKVLYYLIMLMT